MESSRMRERTPIVMNRGERGYYKSCMYDSIYQESTTPSIDEHRVLLQEYQTGLSNISEYQGCSVIDFWLLNHLSI